MRQILKILFLFSTTIFVNQYKNHTNILINIKIVGHTLENKINFLKVKNEISEEEYEYFKNNLQFITNREIYEAVLDKKCLTNLGRFNY